MFYLAERSGAMAISAANAVANNSPKAITLLAKDAEVAVMMNQPPAHTIFPNLKFGLLKGFYGVFHYCKKKGISSYELAKEIGVSQPTARLFHCKI